MKNYQNGFRYERHDHMKKRWIGIITASALAVVLAGCGVSSAAGTSLAGADNTDPSDADTAASA